MGRPRVGLALGGGGARGLSQIGVLKVLVRENIPVDVIAGTSMGAIIGGTYAFHGDIEKLEIICIEYFPRIPKLAGMGNFRSMPRSKDTFGRIFNFLKELYILRIGTSRMAIIDSKVIKDLLDEVFTDHTFDDLKVPFSAIATDLLSGEEVMIREGEMAAALLASSAIPGIFEPIKYDDRLLVDGNVTSQVPVGAVVRMGADVVIGVNVEANLTRTEFRNGIEVLFHVDDLRAAELNQLKMADADVIITPETGYINWAQFGRIEECIKCGEEAAEAMLPQIRQAIDEKSPGILRKILRPFSRRIPSAA